ncbi:MAG: DUF3866 family protein [Armatimonadetes bacterium]|nr:DUF3866 family protein [Armatimonadota bacterium]MDE2207706.1 DUF3866 family protein [Armatimonadota bacterium]
MITRRMIGTVEEVVEEDRGRQILRVRTDGGECRDAIALTALCGLVAVGCRVSLNTAAVELGLGSGGLDFVEAPLDSAEDPIEPAGHILKARYTPSQMPVLAVEAPESCEHENLSEWRSLGELPVVCVELHSQIPAVCAAARWEVTASNLPPPRIVYVMTDGAALSLGVSGLAKRMRAAGLVDAVITSGQAFGGDIEAINLYSALLAAHVVCHADIVVTGQGPGNAGTGTELGFSGVDQGMALNAAASMGAQPIAVARISFADGRARHQGISHHTLTVLKHVALRGSIVPLPRLPPRQLRVVRQAMEAAAIEPRHQAVVVDAERGLRALETTGVEVTTMGRSVQEDRAFFLSAAASGLIAGQLCVQRLRAAASATTPQE